MSNEQLVINGGDRLSKICGGCLLKQKHIDVIFEVRQNVFVLP